MTHVIVSAHADADAANILGYLASRAGPATAVKYNALLESLYDRLTAIRTAARRVRRSDQPFVLASYRHTSSIYDHEPAADRVTILRIVHGRRRISGAMLSPLGK